MRALIKRKLSIVLSLLLIISMLLIGRAAVSYYSNKKLSTNTKATINNIDIPWQTKGRSQVTEGDKSIINDNGIGTLYGFSSPDGAIEFVVSSSQPITATTNNQGYKIRKLSEIDPLWDPGSCAQKPSIEFDNRYIIISEIDGYNLYDIKTRKYKSFGIGDRAKSIYVDGGENMMIIYMYIPQGSINGHGILNSSNAFIIKRSVNLNDFNYIDDKIAITNLEPGQNFTPSIYYDGSRKLTLTLNQIGSNGIDFNDTKRYWTTLDQGREVKLSYGDMGSSAYIDKFVIKPGVYNVDRENTVNGQAYSITDFTVPSTMTFTLGALNI